jgi:hypothetical protein
MRRHCWLASVVGEDVEVVPVQRGPTGLPFPLFAKVLCKPLDQTLTLAAASRFKHKTLAKNSGRRA